jgi:hypothetical protein
MSSISVQSSTTDAIDVDSTNDRYSVSKSNHRSKDGDESNHNSAASFRHLSVASGSSFDSGTYGTSFVSDQSETIERDESFDDDEFGDLDNLSLDSQPMVIDRWVDSACTCLDYPVMLYQKACLGKETSLLRQSKSRSRSTIYHNTTTSTNVSVSGAKRRSLHLKGNAIPENGETNDDENKNEIKIMRIQPNEDFEFKDIEGSERNRDNSQTTRKKEFLVPANAVESDNTFRLESTAMNENRPEDSHEKKQIIEEKKINNEEEQSISNAITKSMLERAIQKVAKEDEERDITSRLSETFKDEDLKIDPPSDAEIAATREAHPADSYPENHPSLKLPTSDRPSESVSQKDEKSIVFPEDPSGRGQRSQSPTVIEQTTTEEASRRSNSSPRTQEREIMSNDEKSLANSVEIIDVLSIDNQDSWTPGSRSDIDHSIAQIGDNRHQYSRTSPRLNDRGNHDQQDDRPISADSSNVDELWIEEETKLSMKKYLNRAASTASKGLTAAQSAEDLWNEERMKLQTTSDVIFDDPKARQAFLGHRQGRLRDAAIDARNTTRSPSRRQKVQKALKDMGREDSMNSKLDEKNSRSKSLGRSRPSPEILSMIEQSRSESRSRAQILPRKPVLSQQGSSRDPLNVAPLHSRKNDLIVVRSIDEGQRIRSSKRDVTKYNAVSRHNLPVDVHRRAGESSSRGPFDEHSNPSHRQPKIDHLIKTSSRQRSKSRDPIGRKGLINVEGPSMKYLLNDERDDQESLPSIRPVEGRPTAAPVEKSWSGYDTAISATKELRKLEKKIERQLRRADLDSQMDQSKEIRRMEKKLSKKLRSIKSGDLDAQRMSPREIRRIEKHLEKTMSSENENRSSKLKRIKLKGVSSTRGPVSSSSNLKEERHHLEQAPSSHSGQNDLQRSPSYGLPRSPSGQSFSEESQDNRPDGSRYENSKSLRSRYARRGIGRRSYSRVPDTD